MSLDSIGGMRLPDERDYVDQDTAGELKRQIELSERSQKEVAAHVEIDAGNFSGMLNGKRRLPRDVAEKAAGFIGWELPNQTDVWYPGRARRWGIPIIPLGAIPMDIAPAEVAAHFAAVEERLPNWTGQEGAYGTFLDADALGLYKAGWVVFVAPKKRPAPGDVVLVRTDGRKFLARWQASPSGEQVADERQAYTKFELMGVIVAHFALY